MTWTKRTIPTTDYTERTKVTGNLTWENADMTWDEAEFDWIGTTQYTKRSDITTSFSERSKPTTSYTKRASITTNWT